MILAWSNYNGSLSLSSESNPYLERFLGLFDVVARQNSLNRLRCTRQRQNIGKFSLARLALTRNILWEGTRRLDPNVHSHGGREIKMADGRSFREVTVPSFQKQGKLIDFTIGSTSTLTVKDEEHGKPHVGGGYAYKESGNLDSLTRNRFIFWFVDKKTLI